MSRSYLQGIFIILLFFFLTMSLEAQTEIKVKARAEVIPNEGIYIEGETSFPDNTVLEVSLSFDGVKVPSTWRKVRTKQGIFQIKLKVLYGKILSGRYMLTVSYYPSRQSKGILEILNNVSKQRWEFPAYLGTPEKERKETTEIKKIIKDAVFKYSEITQDLEEKPKQFLEKLPEGGEKEIQKWAASWVGLHQEQWNQVKTIRPPYVWAPFFPQSIRDLEAIKILCERIFRQTVILLGEKYPNLIPPGTNIDKSELLRVPIPISDSFAEIKRRIENLKTRERILPKATPEMLETDLLQINEIYTRLIKIYELEKNTFRERRWMENLNQWRDDLDYLSTQSLLFYQNCDLIARYPNLYTDLIKLLEKMRNLSELYDNELNQKELAQTPSNLVEDIKKRYELLYQILSKEKNLEKTEKDQFKKTLAEDYKELCRLQKNLDENHKRLQNQPGKEKEWKIWQKEWIKAHSDLQKHTMTYIEKESFQKHFPNVREFILGAVSSLKILYSEYTSDIEGKKAPLYQERVQHFSLTLNKMMDKLSLIVQ